MIVPGMAFAFEGSQEKKVGSPSPPAIISSIEQFALKVARRVHGLYLYSQIRVGMPTDDAFKIVGHLPIREGQFFNHVCWITYREYGFLIAWVPGNGKSNRVSEISLLPW
jgi:hypothetical protein